VPVGALWIHAVSVGEMRAAQPLIEALRADHPDAPILLTCMTPTGRATAESLYGSFARIVYLPYDYASLMRRFLHRAQPRAGILMETELWPNLIHAAAINKVPLMLANARLSERSARGYARLPALARAGLQGIAVVAAQTEADAARLQQLGAHALHVTGNLKFDIAPPTEQLERGAAWKAGWGPRPVLLAASTREGEEAPLLRAFAAAAPADALLVLVPRHPQRFDEVARLIEAAGLAYQRRSAESPLREASRVLLGDSLGELFAYYAACDVAFVGGSLLPLGGQNLIEAASVGRPVLVGPHTFNFEEATRLAIEAGAALRVNDADEWIATALKLLADDPARTRMGEAGLAFAARHRGAAARVAGLLLRR
jgi:3-deoxy-D-manno-octulosonic-acid transferase